MLWGGGTELPHYRRAASGEEKVSSEDWSRAVPRRKQVSLWPSRAWGNYLYTVAVVG